MTTPLNAEQIEFRDSVFQPRFLTERHFHHAFYEDTGELADKCARCHRDLRDPLHFRMEEKVIKEGR